MKGLAERDRDWIISHLPQLEVQARPETGIQSGSRTKYLLCAPLQVLDTSPDAIIPDSRRFFITFEYIDGRYRFNGEVEEVFTRLGRTVKSVKHFIDGPDQETSR